MLAKIQKWGGSRIDGIKNMIFEQNSKLLKPESLANGGNRNSKACRFYWYKQFGCAPPKALLYKATFSQNGAKQSS